MRQSTQKARSYLGLLIALGALILVQPFVETQKVTLENYILSLFFLLLLLGSLKTVFTKGIKPKSHFFRWLIIIFAAVAFLTDLLEAIFWGKLGGVIVLGRISTVGYAGLIFLLCIFIIKDLFSGDRVTSDKIYGAIAVYLLLGILWTCFYGLVGSFVPDAIITSDGQPVSTFSETLYFSYTTLCTLGYGDITAGDKITMTLTNLEAIAGQLFLAILIARLVGLYISQSREHLPE